MADLEKRPRGRPRTGESPTKGRARSRSWTRIATWIERQPEPKPSPSEAIQRLLEKGLKAK